MKKLINKTLQLRANRRLSFIQQDQISECGHACIAMLANYHGHTIDMHSIRKIQMPSKRGATLMDLIRLSEKLNLNTRALKVPLNELEKVNCPAILHWNMNHFVILKKYNKKYAIIYDPASGVKKILLPELSSSYTGIVLEAEKNHDFEAIKSLNKSTILSLFGKIHCLKRNFFTLLILSFFIEALTLSNPLFIQYVTDGFASSGDVSNLYIVASGFIILTLLQAVTELVRSNFIIYLSNIILDYFSSGIMFHLINLPLSYFSERHKGDILSRFQSIKEIQSKFTTESINTLLDGLLIVLSLAVMLSYNAMLSLIVICGLSIHLTIRFITYYHVKSQTETSITQHANANSKFLEIVQSIMPIKLYSKENTIYRSWKNYFISAMNADIKISRTYSLYNVITITISNLELITILCIGASLVVKNTFSMGMLVAYIAYRQILVSKSVSFIQKIFDFKLLSIQVNRVSDILSQNKDPDDRQDIAIKEIVGNITLKNITFAYPSSTIEPLKNLSIEIRANDKVVITGPSGSGKTTLLKLMLGLLTPTEGLILIDNIPLDLIGFKRYKNFCSSVMQDDSLVGGSILDNVTFFDSTINLDKVYEACKIAHIHDDILKMPMGYETFIGDMFCSLSGGQKQRILLARALYKQPKILFLDEATSHLDVETEININNALKKLNITQVVIAHRKETINMADRIIYI